MRIVTLEYLLRDGLNTGVFFHFAEDLSSPKPTVQNYKYMVVKNGILDMNGSYAVFQPDEELKKKEVLIYFNSIYKDYP